MIAWKPYCKIGDICRLGAFEIQAAKAGGIARQEAREAARSATVRRKGDATREGNIKIHVDGFAGELAFCRLHNCWPDLSIGRTEPGDAVCAGGIVVDVKTRDQDWDLIVMPGKRGYDDAVDVFALMIGSFPGPYKFAGVMGRTELIQDHRIRRLGNGKESYLAKQSELVDLSTWYVAQRARPAA